MARSGSEQRGAETVHHPLFARMYLRAAGRRLEGAETTYRRRLLTGLTGRVIEVGAGPGINFAFYPDTVEDVLAVEPEPLLRAEAVRRAADAPVPVTVVDGVAGALPATADTFAGAVASLVLCSVPDPRQALVELRRVLRPDGELRFYEHVASAHRATRAVQRITDRVLWPRLAGGCHLSRETGSELERAGFVIERCERFTFSPGPPVPPLPHILGMATCGSRA